MAQEVYIFTMWICKHKNKIQLLLEKFLKGQEFSHTFFIIYQVFIEVLIYTKSETNFIKELDI